MSSPCELRWRKIHRDVVNQRVTTWRKNNPDKVKEYRKKQRGMAKIESTAWRKIPLGSKCETCGSTVKLERHHPDYSKPLEIITLCRNCHAKLSIHRRIMKP